MILQRCRYTLASLGAIALIGSVQAGVPPEQEIRTATEEVLEVVAKNADQRTINELAETRIVPRFDFRRMTQLAAGRVWTQANAQQQEALAREFQHLLVRTYTRAITSTSHARANVVVQAARIEDGSDETVVRTTVAEPGRKPIAINYRMERTGGNWKVVDVVVENISLVTNYREWFSAQAKAGGIDGLIGALAEKNRAAAEKAG